MAYSIIHLEHIAQPPSAATTLYVSQGGVMQMMQSVRL
jgi:hypothetical protein